MPFGLNFHIQPILNITIISDNKKPQRVPRFLAAVQELYCDIGGNAHQPLWDQKSTMLNLVCVCECRSPCLMQWCAQAYLSSTGSLTHCWAHAAYDLSLCNDMEAAELDKRLQLINGNVWREIFNTPLSVCLPSGLYGSVCKVSHFCSAL